MSELAREGEARFPRSVFDAPLFRGLDDRATREIETASAVRILVSGERLYTAGEGGDSFFVVAKGRVVLSARRRGDGGDSVLRVVHGGETCGEEVVASVKRQATATAETASTVAEIPVHIFRRAAIRSGKADFADRLEKTLRRGASRDLLRTAALTRDLSDDVLDVVVDRASWCTFARGDAIYTTGDAADAFFLVADGRIQIQTDDGDRLRVRGYLGEGDLFGDDELVTHTRRGATAVASGPSTVLSLPADVLDTIRRADSGVLERVRRMSAGAVARQNEIVRGAARNATAHVFRDLYRLEIARSLLVIDLESCVRCGHCTWTCGALYGTPRLVRRGDKIVTRTEEKREAGGSLFHGSLSEHLMLPSSCQHCENPACMIDCPTGAIGKDAHGDVFIREELCTGCGACARACPWDNIQMSARVGARPPTLVTVSGDVAVKCDLCRTHPSGPACVEACPTAAISRIDPGEDLSEMRALLGRDRAETTSRKPSSLVALLWMGSAFFSAAILAGVGIVVQARHAASPSHGLGYGAGVASACGFLLLLTYSFPKRAVKTWKRFLARRPRSSNETRSVAAPLLVAHVAIGFFATALALAHAPIAGRPGIAHLLLLTFLGASTAGLATLLAYAWVPGRLVRIERTALLPEDFPRERQVLFDRLFRAISGKNEAVKALAGRILLPYAKSRVGWIALLASGRDLRREREALLARVERLVEGRRERLAGLDELVRIVVELRALPAQRVLLGVVRVGLPVHVACFSIAMVLLFLHVVVGVGR